MSQTVKLTVAICTYNRADILRHCLQSIVDARDMLDEIEILVVDNNSTDDTADVVASFQDRIPILRRVEESVQGHSNARNRAYVEAASDWIFYLDDDAKVRDTTFSRVIWMTENQPYKIFGGVYFPWYHYGRPRWFRDEYGSNKRKYEQITELTGDETVSGGVLCMHKDLLREMQGFNPHVGMIGAQIGYWDETELQMRIRSKGYPIAYDPEIQIEHLVAKYKLSPDWYFRRSYIKGRDQVVGDKVSNVPGYLLFTAVVAIAMPLLLMPANFLKLIFWGDYYIENFLIDSFHKSAKRIGIIYTSLLKSYGSPVDK